MHISCVANCTKERASCQTLCSSLCVGGIPQTQPNVAMRCRTAGAGSSARRAPRRRSRKRDLALGYTPGNTYTPYHLVTGLVLTTWRPSRRTAMTSAYREEAESETKRRTQFPSAPFKVDTNLHLSLRQMSVDTAYMDRFADTQNERSCSDSAGVDDGVHAQTLARSRRMMNSSAKHAVVTYGASIATLVLLQW